MVGRVSQEFNHEIVMLKRKTAWLESQYLFPHHFQQQERYFEARIEDRCAAIKPYVWGFNELELDKASLNDGRLALEFATGVMPDGAPFEIPSGGALPTPLAVPANARDQLVYLALPVYQPGGRFVDPEPDGAGDRIARYRLRTAEVFDYCGGDANPEVVETAELSFSLLLEGEELGGYVVLPVARIREVTQEGAVILESGYIPPTIDSLRNTRLSAYLNDVLGLLKQRADALAVRFNQSGRAGGSAAITDFLLLQLSNRYESRFRHLASLERLHPERLYFELAGLAGELATFTTDAKRPAITPHYRHNDLHGCFHALIETLGRQLSAVLEQTAIPMPIEERQFGIRVSRITDRSLLKQARYVLAAKADVPTDTLRTQLPALLKVGAVETIRTLVNNQLPGIGISQLPVAPREIPYHAGCVYFELDTDSEHWQQLRNAGGFAFHVAGDFPGLSLELWAIRQ